MKLLQFIKNWTLSISMGIGAVAYLVFYYVPALEGASQWFAPIFNSILPLFMFLILYVTFCKVDFRKIAIVPWHWWMVVVQCLLVGIGVGAILLFGIVGKELILLEHTRLHYKSVCCSSCRSNPKTRW